MRAGLDLAERGLAAGDALARAAARAQVWTALLDGGYQVVGALNAGEAATALAWLPLREFRHATRFSRPGGKRAPGRGLAADPPLPYWAGFWLGLYATWEGLLFQTVAAAFVIGGYVLAEYLNKRAQRAAVSRAPAHPAPRAGAAP